MFNKTFVHFSSFLFNDKYFIKIDQTALCKLISLSVNFLTSGHCLEIINYYMTYKHWTFKIIIIDNWYF